MIKGILLTLLVVFAALGICEFIHTLKSAFLFPGIKSAKYSVILLKHGFSSQQLRYFAYKLRWYGSELCDKIIAVTDNLSDTEIADCEKFCYGSDVYICKFSEIPLVINSFETGENNDR